MLTPLTEAQKQEAVKALQEHGNKSAAARALGISRSTFRHRYDAATRDPAIQASMAAVGTSMVPALVWAKTKSEDGTSYSTLLKPVEAETESMAQCIADALEGMEPARLIEPPKETLSDLCTVYPIADRHQGMRAIKEEVGEEYNNEIAKDRLKSWMAHLISSSPASEEAVIIDIGDGEHMNDSTNTTPKSKHQLDVDGNIFIAIDASVESLAYSIDLALQKHDRVTVRILPGNHNPDAYIAVTQGIYNRFLNNPRVTVEKVMGGTFIKKFGKCLIAADHTHAAKPERIVLMLADDYAEIWGATRHRVLFTAHDHHLTVKDIGGVRWERLRPMTSRDAYAKTHAYSSRSQLNAITLHKERGEIQRVSVGV